MFAALLSSLSLQTLRSGKSLISGWAADKSSEFRGAHSCYLGLLSSLQTSLKSEPGLTPTNTQKLFPPDVCAEYSTQPLKTQGSGLQLQARLLNWAHFLLLTLMWSELGTLSCLSETWSKALPSLLIEGNNSCTKRSWQLNPAHWIRVCSRINPDYLT